MQTVAKGMAQKPLKSSADDFESVARQLECDESEAAFERTLKKIAKAPLPKPGKKKVPK